MLLQQLTPAQILLRGDLFFPLEGCVGFGHKVGCGHMDPQAPLFVDGVGFPSLNDLIDQFRNAQHILVRLRRQAQHEIELHAVPAPGKGLGAGGENLFLCQILIDNIPQPLGSRLRGEGQAGFADGLELFHQLPGEVVRPQGRHGQADMVCLTVGQHFVRQFFQPTVIRCRQAGKGNFVEAGGLHQLYSLIIQHLRAFLPHGTAGKACLTEPAAPDTAPEHLQIGPVVDDLRRGNDHLRGEIGGVQIFHDTLGDHLRRAFQRRHGGQHPIFGIGVLVEGGHIHAGDLGNFLQKTGLVPVFPLRPFIHIQNFHRDVLPLAQREEIHEVRQGFRVKGADAACKNHILKPLPVSGMQRDAGQAQHIENIGIGHFVANGKGHHIKIPHRILAFQRPEGEAVVPHGLLHISPGGKDTLAPHIGDLVHDPVENAHTHIGHTDLIGVREAKGHSNGHVFLVFPHLPPFAAHITGGLLYRGQNTAFQICHLVTSLRILPIYCTRFSLHLQENFPSFPPSQVSPTAAAPKGSPRAMHNAPADSAAASPTQQETAAAAFGGSSHFKMHRRMRPPSSG